LIPPLALFVAIVRLQAYRFTWLTAALLLGSIAGVVLGALQVTGSGNVADSHWYLYDVTNYGFATGFFANVNHMADLLVCTLPFLAAMGLVLWAGGLKVISGALSVGELTEFLAYMAILHGRMDKLVGPLGVAALSIIAFLTILMTYIGVNFVLTAGLHSYGFGSSSVVTWLLLVAVLETAFIGAGFATRAWRKRTPHSIPLPTS